MEPRVTNEQQLFERLASAIVAELTAKGVAVPDAVKGNVAEALLIAFRLGHRSIAARPREVRFSQELAERDLPQDLRERVDEVARELSVGVDVTPRLTRRFFKARFNDRLFNDLAIHHMHLAPRDPIRGGVAGSAKILFALVTEEAVLLLDVADHSAFIGHDFIGMIDRNWPEALRRHRLDGIAPGVVLTPKERASFRRSGTSAALTLPDGVFLPPGGVVTLDGASVRALQAVQEVIYKVRRNFEWVVGNATELASAIAQETGVRVDELDVAVVQLPDGELAFLESNTGALIEPAAKRWRLLRPAAPSQSP